MNTYWFTIASNSEYTLLCQDLQATAQHHGIKIHIITADTSQVSKYSLNSRLSEPVSPSSIKLKPEEEKIKKLKINSILNVPLGYERIVYLDADTLLVNPNGISEINGSLKEPWKTQRALLPKQWSGENTKRWRQKLWRLLRQEGLENFCPGGIDHKQEWNSGVIAGDHKFMESLAQEWLRWWELILDICDGYFERDQISYKFAYTLVARKQYGFESIPPDYNCIVKRMGFSPSAHILHRAGLPKRMQGWRYQRIRKRWETAKQVIPQDRYRSWSQSLPSSKQ